MKRIFTLATLIFAGLFISMASFAASPRGTGRIIINSNDNSFITVRVNGRSYNVNQQPMILANLVGGKHLLQIYRTENRPYTFARSKPELIFNQPVYVDASYIVDLLINRYGQVSMTKSLTVINGNNRYDDRYDDRYYDNKRGGQYENRGGQYDNRNGGQYDNRGGQYDKRDNDGRNGGQFDNRNGDNKNGGEYDSRKGDNRNGGQYENRNGGQADTRNGNPRQNQNPNRSSN